VNRTHEVRGSNPLGSTNCPLLHNADPHNADWHYAGLRNRPACTASLAMQLALDMVSSTRTRIEREFDPEAAWQLKARAGRDISVRGPELAAHAIKAGLVDEYHLFVHPVVVGGGKQSLPDGVRVNLELVDERRSAAAWFISTTAPEHEARGPAQRNAWPAH
jgi:hypothetical protein